MNEEKRKIASGCVKVFEEMNDFDYEEAREIFYKRQKELIPEEDGFLEKEFIRAMLAYYTEWLIDNVLDKIKKDNIIPVWRNGIILN